MRKTKTEKRMEVLKDVLKTLNSKNIVCGTYCEIDYTGNNLVKEYFEKQEEQLDSENPDPAYESCDFEVDLQKLLPASEENCSVCALGSLFISTVRKYDDFEVMVDGIYDSQEIYRDDIVERLEKLFSQKQMNMIEAAFEGHDVSGILTEKEDDQCHRFFKKHFKGTTSWNGNKDSTEDGPKKRLRAIVKNMIKNNGIFIP